MRDRALRFSCVGLAVGLLLSCGGGSSHGSHAAFVTIAEGDRISVFNVDNSDGVLSNVTGSPFLTGKGPADVVVDPANKFAYVLNQTEATISQFKINGDRSLTEVMPRTSTGVTPSAEVMDKAGTFLYVTNSGSQGSVSVYSIDGSTGSLQQMGQSSPTGLAPTKLALAPSGNFLYVINQNSNSVSIYSVASGVLTAVGPQFDVGQAPTGLAINPAGTFLYLTFEAANQFNGYAIDPATGSLSPISTVPFAAGNAPVGVTIDPSGKYLYIANSHDDTVSGFTLDATTGTPTQIRSTSSMAGSPWKAGNQPVVFSMDPSGMFLFVANTKSANITAFSIDSGTGILTAINGSPFSLSGSPSAMFTE